MVGPCGRLPPPAETCRNEPQRRHADPPALVERRKNQIGCAETSILVNLLMTIDETDKGRRRANDAVQTRLPLAVPEREHHAPPSDLSVASSNSAIKLF